MASQHSTTSLNSQVRIAVCLKWTQPLGQQGTAHLELNLTEAPPADRKTRRMRKPSCEVVQHHWRLSYTNYLIHMQNQQPIRCIEY